MIIEQIAKVIHYLSSQIPAIIHYDLKPQNIIFSKGQLKVLDFGICKTMDSEHSKMALTSQGMGTCCYLPP
jgi:tousled-like kinase